MSRTSVSIRCDPVGPSSSISARRQVVGTQDPGPQGVVDVVVDVGDAVDQLDDPALQRRRLVGAGVVEDAVADLLGQVEADAVALEHLDHPQRVLVVLEADPAALAQRRVESRLAGVAEGRVAEVVAEPDRLGQVLVEAERAGHRAGDPAGLERVRQPGPVVVAFGGDEDLGLVLEPAEGLGVDDPVAVALKRRPQRAVGLLDGAPRRIGAGRLRRQELLLPGDDPVLESGSRGHPPIIGGAGPVSTAKAGLQAAEAKLHVSVVLERLADGALDLAQRRRLGLGRLAERLRQRLDHEPVRFLGEAEGAGFAAAADDAPGGAGEAGQVLGLAAARAGGELGDEAGDQRQLEPEGERRFEAGAARVARRRRAGPGSGRAGCRRAGSARPSRAGAAPRRRRGRRRSAPGPRSAAAGSRRAWRRWSPSSGRRGLRGGSGRAGRTAPGGHRSGISACASPLRSRRSAPSSSSRGGGCDRPRCSGCCAGRSPRS